MLLLSSVISFWLFVLKIAEHKPIVILEAYEPDVGSKAYFQVRIANPSKYPILITKVRVLWPRSSAFFRQVRDIRRPDLLGQDTSEPINLLIQPNGELPIRFALATEDDQPCIMIIRVGWFRNQPFILPRLPRFIIRTRQSLRAIADDPVED